MRRSPGDCPELAFERTAAFKVYNLEVGDLHTYYLSGLALLVHNDRANRGRIQAQGGGTEKSVRWAQHSPPTRAEGHAMLDTLEGKLMSSELADRAELLQRARRRIDSTAESGGADAPVSKTFLKKDRLREISHWQFRGEIS